MPQIAGTEGFEPPSFILFQTSTLPEVRVYTDEIVTNYSNR